MTEKKRRVPKQARSKKRYDRILDTAAHLFTENGINQVSTNHIAETAEISIGSIYQFFPNKEAIIEGLIERYMTAASDVFPKQLDPKNTPITQVIHNVLSGFVRFKNDNQGFQTILIGLEGTSNANANQHMQEAIVGGIEQVLQAYYPHLQTDRRRLCAQVSLSIVAGIMPHDMPEELMISEMVLATNAYQQAFLAREINHD